MFDNEIRVTVQIGDVLNIRDDTPGDEQHEHEGYLVDRSSVDFTSLCAEGINKITVSFKDKNSGKVGFVTPVYVMRRR